jgi:hypothetical protein
MLPPEHDDKPVCCWINSQSPTEPIYTGCARIPVIYMDVMENWNTIDLNCEGPHQKPYEQLFFDILQNDGIVAVFKALKSELALLQDCYVQWILHGKTEVSNPYNRHYWLCKIAFIKRFNYELELFLHLYSDKGIPYPQITDIVKHMKEALSQI